MNVCTKFHTLRRQTVCFFITIHQQVPCNGFYGHISQEFNLILTSFVRSQKIRNIQLLFSLVFAGIFFKVTGNDNGEVAWLYTLTLSLQTID